MIFVNIESKIMRNERLNKKNHILFKIRFIKTRKSDEPLCHAFL